MSGVSTKHKLFTWMEPAWEKMGHVMEGRRRIEGEGEKYLPKPPALSGRYAATNDPQGLKWQFYKSFAVFPDFTKIFRIGVLGIVNRKPPAIELPPRMEYLRDNATPDGRTLVKLWQDIVLNVLDTGRIGLLPESTTDTAAPITLCQYAAPTIINWRSTTGGEGTRARLLVLQEDSEIDGTDEFQPDTATFYRVLRLDGDRYVQDLYRADTKISKDPRPLESDANGITYPAQPSYQGRSFEGIPFVCINAIDLKLRPGTIPMEPLADKALDIYRATATYHRALYAKGDPNIVRTGITKEEADANSMVGGGTMWNIGNPEAKAFYLDLDGSAIPYQRAALQDHFVEAREQAGRLIDSQQRQRESGEALAERRQSQQVTTVTVVDNAAQGVRRVLRHAATVLGENPDKIKFDPDTSFIESLMTGPELDALMNAVIKGAPLSMESIHQVQRRGGLTTLSYEEERDKITEEAGLGMFPGMMGPGGPTPDDE